jgi:hypothetical protein
MITGQMVVHQRNRSPLVFLTICTFKDVFRTLKYLVEVRNMMPQIIVELWSFCSSRTSH